MLEALSRFGQIEQARKYSNLQARTRRKASGSNEGRRERK